MEIMCDLELMRGSGMPVEALALLCIAKPTTSCEVEEVSVASDGGMMAIYVGIMSGGVPTL